MTIKSVIEVVSYELRSDDLVRYLRIPDDEKAIALPLSTPDGLPNHLQVLVLDD